MWSKDVRHGVGTMYSPNGSIFVGTYVSDKRQGLGVTYWGSRCKKHVAEYVDDTPTCGSMLDLADEEVEVPAIQQLREAIAAARVKAAGAAAAAADSTTQPCMPELQLVQPSQVCAGAPTLAACGGVTEGPRILLRNRAGACPKAVGNKTVCSNSCAPWSSTQLAV